MIACHICMHIYIHIYCSHTNFSSHMHIRIDNIWLGLFIFKSWFPKFHMTSWNSFQINLKRTQTLSITAESWKGARVSLTMTWNAQCNQAHVYWTQTHVWNLCEGNMIKPVKAPAKMKKTNVVICNLNSVQCKLHLPIANVSFSKIYFHKIYFNISLFSSITDIPLRDKAISQINDWYETILEVRSCMRKAIATQIHD